MNRFSYVINNPLRLTDPTGHDFCDYHPSLCSPHYEPGSGVPGDPSTGGGSGGGSGGSNGGSNGGGSDKRNSRFNDRPGPDYIDPNNLTMAGKDGYKVYLLVYDTDEWWWSDPNLGGDGQLTIEDFVTMNYNEELGNYRGPVSDWQEALVRGYHTWKSTMDATYGPGVYTSGKAGVLNFMSRQTNIASHRPGPANFDGPAAGMSIARSVVDTQINATGMGHGDWAVGCISNRPCQTGSHGAGSRDLPYIRTFISQGCEPSYSVFPHGSCDFNESFMFILDADDVTYWDDVVDK